MMQAVLLALSGVFGLAAWIFCVITINWNDAQVWRATLETDVNGYFKGGVILTFILAIAAWYANNPYRALLS